RKILILFLATFAVIFCHYYNQHKILINAKEVTRLQDEIKSYREMNQNLTAENYQLSSRERIQELAYSQLGMFYPDNYDHVYNIQLDKAKENFFLIDYIVPSVEALNK
ncbi:MAG: cell division protein FtsL, partial [Candidatus Cloacimonetes bacterium]|nr:cell division protein FtsL [Candidatus Cloacimonadota bacterium]